MINVINKAMDIDLKNRYANAHQFRQALKGISIPIDWVLTSNKENRQIWKGTNGGINYKLEISKKLLNPYDFIY